MSSPRPPQAYVTIGFHKGVWEKNELYSSAEANMRLQQSELNTIILLKSSKVNISVPFPGSAGKQREQ